MQKLRLIVMINDDMGRAVSNLLISRGGHSIMSAHAHSQVGENTLRVQ